MADPKPAGAQPSAKPLFANRIASDRSKVHLLHWCAAALLHVPFVYALLAITVSDTRSDPGEPAFPGDDDFAAPVVFGPGFDPAPPTALRREQRAATGAVASNPRDASAPIAGPGATATPVTPSALQRMSPATPPAAGLIPRANSGATAPPIEIARARIVGRLAPVNDSIAESKRAKQDADDMTVTDRNGNLWGMSRGTLHLGDKTIRLAYATNGGPVPDLIVPSPGKRDEVNAAKRNWLEIEMQSNRALINRTFDQRATEMRQRRDSTRINTLATGTTTKRRNEP
jgi:hypothetical protein